MLYPAPEVLTPPRDLAILSTRSFVVPLWNISFIFDLPVTGSTTGCVVSGTVVKFTDLPCPAAIF